MNMQSHLEEKQKSKKNHINFEIVEYKPEYKVKYKELNYEWLERYFEVESSDEKILSNPEKEILDKNGFIFFALFNDEVIGTCTLIKNDDTCFELSKMCVIEKYQRNGAGEKLLDKAISKAYQLGIKKIVLSTNSRLTAALNLYKKKGFKDISDSLVSKCFYKRESTFMYLNLNLDYEEEK